MMHTYYSDKNLPSTKAGYEIFVAEVASTVNEMLLVRTLLDKTTDSKEKLYFEDNIELLSSSNSFIKTKM